MGRWPSLAKANGGCGSSASGKEPDVPTAVGTAPQIWLPLFDGDSSSPRGHNLRLVRFVLVDRFLFVEPGKRSVALKAFDAGEAFFEDHFPGFPVVPGVLLTEAIGQTAGWLIGSTLGPERWPLLVRVDRARFVRLVRPGEEILLEAEVTSVRGEDFETRGTAKVGGELAADARLLFHAFPRPPEAGPAGFDDWARGVAERTGLAGLKP